MCSPWWTGDCAHTHEPVLGSCGCVTDCQDKHGGPSAYRLAAYIFLALWVIKIWSFFFQAAFLESEVNAAVSLRSEIMRLILLACGHCVLNCFSVPGI